MTGAQDSRGIVVHGRARLRRAAVKPPVGSPTSGDGDHDELLYELVGWAEDRRGALTLMLTGAAIPHSWEGDVLVVPQLREAEVDELIDSIEEGVPVGLPADVPVRPPSGVHQQRRGDDVP
jgi:hypothetical protein